MSEPLNWGVIGTGFIARKLTEALAFVPGAKLWSVVSRNEKSAAQFAQSYGATKHYTSYEEFANDPQLDAVLVGTPHPMHVDNTLLCLNAGKHVLCEKPLALNTQQVKAMLEAARSNQRFLMEAMWMWFIPAIIKARELIDAGEIGEPNTLMADFGFYAPFDPKRRTFAPELGGGALLDIGIYPLALALFLFGKPDSISGTPVIGETGVDEQITMTLTYTDGRIANGTSTLRANTPCEAIIAGTEGYLRIHRDFWYSERLSLFFHHKHSYSIDMPLHGNGYNYEIAETMRCIRDGKLQSDVMSWQASLDLMWMMDTLRADWGLRYPGE